MAIRIERVIYMSDLRNFCIRHNYYTGGDGEAYDRLLTELRDKVNSASTEEEFLDAILILAEDIVDHSDIGDKLYKDTQDWQEVVDNIVYLLLQENTVTQYIIRDNS